MTVRYDSIKTRSEKEPLKIHKQWFQKMMT